AAGLDYSNARRHRRHRAGGSAADARAPRRVRRCRAGAGGDRHLRRAVVPRRGEPARAWRPGGDLGGSGGDRTPPAAARGAEVLPAVAVAIGVLGGAASTRLWKALLFGVSPLEPAVLAIVTAVVAIVSLLAACVPAIRAAAVDVVVVLRSE